MLVVRNPLPGSRELGYVDAALRRGQLVMVPTDTVYGIAAFAEDEHACAKLYAVKRRDRSQQVAVLFARLDHLYDMLPSLSSRAITACEALLPGPYTLVVRNSDGAFPWLCGDNPDAIGVRVPAGAEPLPPLAATSANVSGEPEVVRPDELPAPLRDEVACAIDRGPLPAGAASTVLELTAWEATGAHEDVRVLRDPAARATRALAILAVARR